MGVGVPDSSRIRGVIFHSLQTWCFHGLQTWCFMRRPRLEKVARWETRQFHAKLWMQQIQKKECGQHAAKGCKLQRNAKGIETYWAHNLDLCVHGPPAEVVHLFRCYTHTHTYVDVIDSWQKYHFVRLFLLLDLIFAYFDAKIPES